MPTAHELYTAGRLDSAIETLGAELRSNPTDAQRRAFLFELLSFAGRYDRAAKQLDALAHSANDGELAVLPYRAALQAEQVREHMFATGDLPVSAVPAPVSGTHNGRAFASIEDADPRVGARLEVIAGGRYLWIPWAYVASVHIDPPRFLRDLRWLPAQVSTNESMRDVELGEVLLPTLSPSAWRNADPALQLGRATDWEELPDGSYTPIGQKMLLIDGEYVPIIKTRDIVISPVRATLSEPPFDSTTPPA
jgi:type VI secretion system protein ImpE